MIIFLNGSSSAGKSSLARALQKQSTTPLLLHSIDHLCNVWLDEKFITVDSHNYLPWEKEWFFHKQEIDSDGYPIIRAHGGQKALQFSRDIIEIIGLLAQKGHDFVIDEALWHLDIVKAYARAFAGIHPLYLIKIFCDLDEAERREKNRGDRFLGTARGLANQVYTHISCYDLEVDTTGIPQEINARKILDFIEKNPNPTAFKKSFNF